MNFQFYLEKLFSSNNYEEFIKQNPKSFLTSGFFSIDKKGYDNQQHLDFFNPETNNLFSFKINEDSTLLPIESNKELTYTQLKENIDFNFEEIEEKIIQEMQNQKINNKIEKILISLQTLDNSPFLITTIFLSNLALLKVNISLETMQITDFEKKSFFDIFKILKK